MLKLLSFTKKKVEMLRRVFVFIKYYLTYKNIARTENQSQDRGIKLLHDTAPVHTANSKRFT